MESKPARRYYISKHPAEKEQTPSWQGNVRGSPPAPARLIYNSDFYKW